MMWNAKDIPLNQNSGTVPNVSVAMQNWFQAMIFSIITKTVVNYKVVETKVDMNFRGVWQNLSPQQLQLKPEGQRAWRWYQVHAEISLQLYPDQVINYLGKDYRVMARIDQALYGYLEYHLVEDYT